MTCKTCGDRRTVHYAESTCQPAHEGPCPSCVGVTIATVSASAVSGSAEVLREALKRQMEAQDEHLPSSEARDRGLVWLEGWFDLRAALTEGQQS